MWLVPYETAAVSAQFLCTPYNHARCHLMESHIRKVYACLAVTCHLHFWQNDRDLLRATAVTPAGVERILKYSNKFKNFNHPSRGNFIMVMRVSTESRPWRIKFSRRSCRDLNLRLISHESALTTELSPPPSLERILFVSMGLLPALSHRLKARSAARPPLKVRCKSVVNLCVPHPPPPPPTLSIMFTYGSPPPPPTHTRTLSTMFTYGPPPPPPTHTRTLSTMFTYGSPPPTHTHTLSTMLTYGSPHHHHHTHTHVKHHVY